MDKSPLNGAGRAGRTSGAWLHRYAVLVSASTFFLIFAGGLVTSTDSGLAVPDWPLSFGQVFPEMTGGVFYEHGHRMVAAAVGLLTVGLVIWAFAGRERSSVRRLAAIALGTVILQGLLGGLTVLMKLPPAVSAGHACLAQAFLCMTVALAVMSGRRWPSMSGEARRERGLSLRWIATITVGAVYVQLILGAVMRHIKAGMAIPTFPLAFGKIIPPIPNAAVGVHFAHRVGALVVVLCVVWLAARVLRAHRDEALLLRPAILLVVLTAAQVTLGAYTIWTAKAVYPTTFHVLCGAAILGTSFLLALRAHRLIPARAGRRAAAGAVPNEVPA